jgi:hypothetical protein
MVASTPEKPQTASRELGDPAEQLVKAHGSSARNDAAAIAGDQAVSAQFPNRALYSVSAALLPQGFDAHRDLQDRQLRGPKEQDFGEDRPFHDLVLLSGRQRAPLDIVVLHGKYPFLCHAPGCLRSAGALLL